MKKKYWLIVVDCLIEFHDIPKAEAIKLTKEYKNKFKLLGKETYNFLFHEGSFTSACHIAKNDIQMDSERYEAIVEKHKL